MHFYKIWDYLRYTLQKSDTEGNKNVVIALWILKVTYVKDNWINLSETFNEQH